MCENSRNTFRIVLKLLRRGLITPDFKAASVRWEGGAVGGHSVPSSIM